MKLFYRTYGYGQPLIILHGLFGSSDNWTTLAKKFSTQFNVFTIDQRNHGQSPHRSTHNYKLLAEDLYAFIDEHRIKKPILLGHSMGGKTVMNFATKYPDKLGHLVVVDISPRRYSMQHDHILKGLNAIPLAKLHSRSQADQVLSQYVPELPIRQFLLKNLTRNHNNKFRWKINLPVLSKYVDEMGSEMQNPGQFYGPSLFIKGSQSNYIMPKDENEIKTIFPESRLVTLNTGHWVHAEKPNDFARVILEFFSSS